MSVTWRVDRTQLLEPFGTDVNDVLDADEAQWVVTYGRRTHAVQADLYAKYLAGGPKAAPPGQSPHEAGLAIDCTLVVDGKDIWDYNGDPNWQRLYATIQAHPRLHSGISFDDGDHIEAVHWRQIAAAS